MTGKGGKGLVQKHEMALHGVWATTRLRVGGWLFGIRLTPLGYTSMIDRLLVGLRASGRIRAPVELGRCNSRF